MSLLPTFRELAEAQDLPAASAKQRPPRAKHRWAWSGLHRRWVCECCGLKATKRHNAKCMQMPMRRMKYIEQAAGRGHQLHAFLVGSTYIEPLPMVVCIRCGMYMQGRVAGLRRHCVPQASSQKQRLRRILLGKHPVSKSNWVKHSHRICHRLASAKTSDEQRPTQLMQIGKVQSQHVHD